MAGQEGRRGRRGQSLVEMALTLPMMVSLIMGIIDVSFVLYANIQVAAACGEGARAGALFPGDLNLSVGTNDAARAQVVRNAIYNAGSGTTTMGMLKTTSPNFAVSTDVDISYPNPPSNNSRTGDEMVVTVRYRQKLWFDFLPGAVLGLFQVSSSTRVRIQ